MSRTCSTFPPVDHDYLSTACLHDFHDYCAAPTVSRDGTWAVLGPSYSTERDAPKQAAQCKFCSALCRCACHQDISPDGNVSAP